MKKKFEVTIKCQSKEAFDKYFSPDYNRIVGKKF